LTTGSQGNEVHVLVGVVEREDGKVLLARRPAGKHMAGFWEFPGGKRQADESPLTALRRELEEELGVEVLTAEPLTVLTHDYPDRCVRLDVWCVGRYSGAIVAREGQELQWVELSRLAQSGLLPADGPIVDALHVRRKSLGLKRAGCRQQSAS
jgi:8-oxo-dGTP diphosphatase